MNKKFLILIAVLGLILLVGGGLYIFSSKQAATPGTNSGESEGLSFRDFIPFGGFRNPPPQNTDTEPDTVIEEPEPGEQAPSLPRLRKLSTDQVSGFGALTLERPAEIPVSDPDAAAPAATQETQEASAVRWSDKGKGHIIEMFLDKTETKLLSTTTIPKIHSSTFTNNSESVINRYLSVGKTDIETHYGTLVKGPDGEYSSLSGTFLPKNILELALSPDSSKIFYLSILETGTVGTVASANGSNKIQVFTSQFTEWLAEWPNAKLITVTTKPSARSLGYMYSIDPGNKSSDKILGGISGLTTLTSPNGEKVLYSASVTNGFTFNIYDRTKKTALSLGLTTLPEKCVWAKDSSKAYCAVPSYITPGDYPDSWYQGLTSFSDSIWKLDPVNNIFELVYDPSDEGGEIFDAVSLAIAPKGDYLLFINKLDNSLWSLSL